MASHLQMVRSLSDSFNVSTRSEAVTGSKTPTQIRVTDTRRGSCPSDGEICNAAKKFAHTATTQTTASPSSNSARDEFDLESDDDEDEEFDLESDGDEEEEFVVDTQHVLSPTTSNTLEEFNSQSGVASRPLATSVQFTNSVTAFPYFRSDMDMPEQVRMIQDYRAEQSEMWALRHERIHKSVTSTREQQAHGLASLVVEAHQFQKMRRAKNLDSNPSSSFDERKLEEDLELEEEDGANLLLSRTVMTLLDDVLILVNKKDGVDRYPRVKKQIATLGIWR